MTCGDTAEQNQSILRIFQRGCNCDLRVVCFNTSTDLFDRFGFHTSSHCDAGQQLNKSVTRCVVCYIEKQLVLTGIRETNLAALDSRFSQPVGDDRSFVAYV